MYLRDASSKVHWTGTAWAKDSARTAATKPNGNGNGNGSTGK